MSINDATPEEWDALTDRDRYYDNRSYTTRSHSEGVAVAPDPVNQPQHYRVGEVEAIDYIAQQLGVGVKDYLLGNLHKYIHRHRFKGQPVEDLRKAQWYLDKLIMEEVQGG
jgi:hypothetical protein